AGLHQIIAVQPKTAYAFSAYFKSGDMEGAGGPRFVLQDTYNKVVYFESDLLKDADYWKSVDGVFTTGPDTRLLLLWIQRIPANDPMKGRLWIDGVRLTPRDNTSGGSH